MRKKINLILMLIIIIQFFAIFYFYKGAIGLSLDLNQYSKDTNLLNIERDFEVYYALQENNLTFLKNNLDINIMFHFKPIEIDGLKNQIILKNTNRVCLLYHKIEKDFKKEYINRYPSAIIELDSLCH